MHIYTPNTSAFEPHYPLRQRLISFSARADLSPHFSPQSHYNTNFFLCQAPKRKKVALTLTVATASSATPLKRKSFFLGIVALTLIATARIRVATTPQKARQSKEKSRTSLSFPIIRGFVAVSSGVVPLLSHFYYSFKGYLLGFVRK